MVLSKKELGNLIKQARKIHSKRIDKKYTQQMLANDIGKSQSYIGDIESGRTYPSFAVLNEIAKACHVPIGYFQDDQKINEDIDKFIKLQLTDLEDGEVHKIREAIKEDPDTRMNYIYNLIHEDNSDTLYEKSLNNSFKTAAEAISYILKEPVIKELFEFDINKVSAEEMIDFTNEIVRQIKLISYKYKK